MPLQFHEKKIENRGSVPNYFGQDCVVSERYEYLYHLSPVQVYVPSCNYSVLQALQHCPNFELK